MDAMYMEMNLSTDRLLDNLGQDEFKLKEITEHLFKFFEQRSLFKASEHLSIAMLTQNSCTLDDKLANRFEYYRKMKNGNIAPDIDFASAIVAMQENKSLFNNDPLKGYTSLEQIPNKYRLLFFGAEWCPNCKQQLPLLAKLYPKLQHYDMEIIYISLDDDMRKFKETVENKPWVSYCDFNKWESLPIKDYHIFASPIMILLNEKMEIIDKPVSIPHLEAILKKL
jgi:thiol-disulfide isomerase/thioredoxin